MTQETADQLNEVRLEIYTRLVSIKGIGAGIATKCTDEVVKYLCEVMEGVNTNVDEEEIPWVESPFEESMWTYLTWSTDREIMWGIAGKPSPPMGDCDHWHADGFSETPLFMAENLEFWNNLPDVPPEQRLLRLYKKE